HVALFDAAPRDRLLDRDDNHVADPGGLALRAAEHLDALHPPRAGIVGDIEIGLHLDHAAPPAPSAAWPLGFAAARRRFAGAGFSAAAGFSAFGLGSTAGAPSTTQFFRFDSGRLSSMLTLSPEWKWLPSSCAAYFFERLMNFL